MRSLYINNDGAGFADHVEIAEGLTVAQLFAQRVPEGSPADYLIRVNRQPAASDQILQPGDRISFTPTKIEGAGRIQAVRLAPRHAYIPPAVLPQGRPEGSFFHTSPGDLSMPPYDPHFWRAAGHLEHFLKSRADDHRPSALIGRYFSQLQSLTERLQIAEHHRWDSAAQAVARQLHAQLKCCEAQIVTTLATLEIRFTNSDAPIQAALYEELIALRNEFEDCVVDLRNRTLSVVTEPIVLEEVELGPFRIVLHWDPVLAHVSPYTVQAIHPCCPEGRSDITHPHVTRDRLCEGDAKQVLRQALRSGRLTDFFQIIVQVLHTYNSHSPYASLEEWEGIDCHACGTHTARDSSYCHVCEAQVCDGCSGYCSCCDTSACEACTRCCARCDQFCCRNCADVCRECGEKVCPRCFTTHNLCQECDDANPTEELESENVSTAEESPAGLAVQPVGLGQIAMHA